MLSLLCLWVDFSLKTTTVYSLYVVDANGRVQIEDFVKDNGFFYKYPSSPHDTWKSLILGCDIFETREQADKEAASFIDYRIKELKKTLISIQKEITTLRERNLNNYND